MTDIFNPGRLDLARRRRGMTKFALAETAGISIRNLSAYERGDYAPSPETLAVLAVKLDFPVEFFSGGELEEPPIEAASFRALSTLTARQRDQALGAGTLALALSDWISDRFSLPEPDVPTYETLEPETAAMTVRAEWGLGEQPIRNMIHLLEARGVSVFSLAEECREIDAFSFWRRETPYVFLNTLKSAERSRMDAAHELGHLVMHRRGPAQGRDAEREANLFGSAFLMPRGSVLAEAPRGGTFDQIVSAKKIWNVSLANLTYRMHTVGLLSEWQYRSMFVEISRRGKTAEPDGAPGEISQVWAKVFAMLRNEHISINDVARNLSITTRELSKLVFGLLLIAVEGRAGSRPISARRLAIGPV